jgi:hypothetical protein
MELVEDAPQFLAAFRQSWRVEQDLRALPRLPLDRKQMVKQRRAVLFRLVEHELKVGEGLELLD